MTHICRQILKLKAFYPFHFFTSERFLFHCYFSPTDAFEINVEHMRTVQAHSYAHIATSIKKEYT
jgi:hypothetical protein